MTTLLSSWLDPSLLHQFVRYCLVSTGIYLYTKHRQQPLDFSLSFLSIGILGRLWLSFVDKHVPDPYLDEVFHVPQAQVYCDGQYDVWDAKITTPPGLYVLAILANKLAGLSCSTSHLRAFNVEIISYLALLATVSRARVENPESHARDSDGYGRYAFWTGLNISLFPVLFFFSGLYYTDVISTLVVLLAYTNHLYRVGQDRPSIANGVYAVFLGLVALCVRQTNIFWVVVYMGGQEVVHAVHLLRPEPLPNDAQAMDVLAQEPESTIRSYSSDYISNRMTTPVFATLPEQVKFFAWRYSLGDIHDLPLYLASPIDLLLCVISIGIATVSNLGIIVRRHIWPHLVVLSAFLAFVVWNGGVVLGDKSNHIATLHLAQMLYIWPLFAFFSAPLFIPQLWKLGVLVFQSTTTGQKGSTAQPSPVRPDINQEEAPLRDQPVQSASLKFFNYIGSSHTAHTIILLLSAALLSTIIVRFSTIIHPFTLADNRHFMFYIFRYTILRAWWVRYALVPVYVVCGSLCWVVLRGNPQFSSIPYDKRWVRTPFTLTRVSGGGPSLYPSPPASTIPALTSTVLILFLATTLSLITAPLVEPRYFILPWVFWRLLVPSPPSAVMAIPLTNWVNTSRTKKQQRQHGENTKEEKQREYEKESDKYEGEDRDRALERELARAGANTDIFDGAALPKLPPPGQLSSDAVIVLALETVWSLAVNVVTMAVFIAWPFYWRDPTDGTLLDGGRVQRFMW
ncbi:glycosyltransferase family 59 protein [Durotheca rogersii]|uniref:glycosyltransferase family 59 protein n=1 Tax=Durotheca rogersii TaxID=419775 RepID=UPI00221E8ECA|nr:glycosyltransferase family 59 protein [Durotheca rogersii]KAI5862021.1 glycosyltransferase family 59 protein [Durotheca rogersii]